MLFDLVYEVGVSDDGSIIAKFLHSMEEVTDLGTVEGFTIVLVVNQIFYNIHV